MGENFKQYPGKKILLIDDDLVNLKVAEGLIKKFGVNTENGNSAKILLEKIADGNTYDLILLDDMMPETSGTEAMEILKKEKGYKNPIIVLTGNTVDGAKEKYLSDGFDDYIPKPVKPEKLSEYFEKYLG